MSSAVYLTADLGNSALKLVAWRLGDDGIARAAERTQWSAADRIDAELAAWLARRGPFAGIALSSVASAALEATVRAALGASARDRLSAPPDWGGCNDTRTPETVGPDRLFAARGAWECLGSAAVVVDAGTALTVDALVADPERRIPRFLGGAIAPGPRLLAAALAGGGARLYAVEPDPAARALGRDTREAMQAGVAVGFAGAARLLVERIAAEAGISAAPVVLTGGARAFLEHRDCFPERRVHVRELLVHEGLLAAGTEASLGVRWRAAPSR